jgi:hypothetical protein
LRGADRRTKEEVTGFLDVKKLEGLGADWWNARTGADDVRKADLVSSGSLGARRAGP